MSETQHDSELQVGGQLISQKSYEGHLCGMEEGRSPSARGRAVRKKLVTHTHEGFDLAPLYTALEPTPTISSGLPGLPPFVCITRARMAVLDTAGRFARFTRHPP